MRVEQVEPRRKAELCSLLDYSRQAYYQGLKEKEKENLVTELLIQEVIRIRQSQKQVGGRKLLLMTQPFVEGHGVTMGRDKLFDVLRKNRLLVRKRRSNKPRTTWSYHWYKKYPNLIEGFAPQGAGQLWVSDITYIVIGKDFGYLSLVTDAYSRKIVGFCISRNLSAKGSVKALKMALLGVARCDNLIHHSDRGIQYCCTDYVAVLQKKHIRISMTQDGNPLHNALAERMNGILKTELLKRNYSNFKEASEDIGSAINIYNNERLHSSINMLTPHQAHHLSGPIKRLWKNYYPKRKEGPVKAV
jgi:transposase InsO family protein